MRIRPGPAEKPTILAYYLIAWVTGQDLESTVHLDNRIVVHPIVSDDGRNRGLMYRRPERPELLLLGSTVAHEGTKANVERPRNLALPARSIPAVSAFHPKLP